MTSEGLIIFDMDGVLIDVSRSYRETVRQAAVLFFSRARFGDTLPDPLFSLEDLAAVKQSGGLNNDWDLTRLVCSLLFSKLHVLRISQAPDTWQRYTETLTQCDAEPLAHYLSNHESVLTTLFPDKNNRDNAFVNDLYNGDVGSGNIIKQIFQEIYLGSPLFEKTYGLPSRMYTGSGLLHRESLIIEQATLQHLSRQYILAIATGRPAAEALLPLRRYGLESLFRLVYTLDDCLEEEKKIFARTGETVILSKPSPFMLDSIVEKLDARPELYYVGDMPDDIKAAAASRYGFKSIGFLAASPDRRKLRADLQQAGAHEIVTTPSGLERYFLRDNGWMPP